MKPDTVGHEDDEVEGGARFVHHVERVVPVRKVYVVADVLQWNGAGQQKYF